MKSNIIVVTFGGLLFGIGLAWGTMTQQEVILQFLQLQDLGLLLLMGTALIFTAVAFSILPRCMNKPVWANAFEIMDTTVHKHTIIGAVLFGIGWGISGLCPGSALASLGTGNIPVIVGIAGIFVGAYINERWMSRIM